MTAGAICGDASLTVESSTWLRIVSKFLDEALLIWSLAVCDLLSFEEIVAMVSKGKKTAADAGRLFNVHPATVSRLLARADAGTVRVKV
jgi:hypothetical protein